MMIRPILLKNQLSHGPSKILLFLDNIQAPLPKQLPRFGVVYMLEFNNGLIKIGCSSQSAKQIKDLEQAIRQYGQLGITRLAISRECTNYQSVKQQLHQHFRLVNIKDELF